MPDGLYKFFADLAFTNLDVFSVVPISCWDDGLRRFKAKLLFATLMQLEIKNEQSAKAVQDTRRMSAVREE